MGWAATWDLDSMYLSPHEDPAVVDVDVHILMHAARNATVHADESFSRGPGDR